MPKLTDTQLIILSSAGQRYGGAALPLQKSLKLQGGAVSHVLKSLLKKACSTSSRPRTMPWRGVRARTANA